MRDHRSILRQLFKAKELSLADIAVRMGWKSPRTVAHKLNGDRDWATGELERMCEIAGITLVMLAEMADDITLARHPESVTAARLVDGLTSAQREAALQYLKSIASERSD